MVIGRSETRDTPWNPVATLETAVLFGTRVAKPILAAVMCDVRPLDRTYDRKRSDPHAAPPLAGRGPSTYGFRARHTQPSLRRLRKLACVAPRNDSPRDTGKIKR